MSADIDPPGPLAQVLNSVKTIALVGASANPARPSYRVMAFLLKNGFEVIPVNPGLAGSEILGQEVFADLKSIPHPIDMVDIFRNSEAAGEVVGQALQLSPLPRVIWMQLGVINEDAAQTARARGISVVMNHCPAIEFRGID